MTVAIIAIAGFIAVIIASIVSVAFAHDDHPTAAIIAFAFAFAFAYIAIVLIVTVAADTDTCAHAPANTVAVTCPCERRIA